MKESDSACRSDECSAVASDNIRNFVRDRSGSVLARGIRNVLFVLLLETIFAFLTALSAICYLIVVCLVERRTRGENKYDDGNIRYTVERSEQGTYHYDRPSIGIASPSDFDNRSRFAEIAHQNPLQTDL
ncbi:unnamed protein product [Anisakis simplex]|uniref:Uncharacterized protein n=1 Tax=Anisakis simplex TaxID=6269 RepID=A0A3P6PDI4_ANISI|nr:unnamed protein product [Anisakis simplex]